MYPISLHNSYTVIYLLWTQLENTFAASLPCYVQCNISEGCGYGAGQPGQGSIPMAQPQVSSAQGQEPGSSLVSLHQTALFGFSIFPLHSGLFWNFTLQWSAGWDDRLSEEPKCHEAEMMCQRELQEILWRGLLLKRDSPVPENPA